MRPHQIHLWQIPYLVKVLAPQFSNTNDTPPHLMARSGPNNPTSNRFKLLAQSRRFKGFAQQQYLH